LWRRTWTLRQKTVLSTGPDWLTQINSQVFAPASAIVLRVSRGRTRRVSIGTNGLNSGAMSSFCLLPAILLFPAVLCVCSFGRGPGKSATSRSKRFRSSVDRVNVGVIVHRFAWPFRGRTASRKTSVCSIMGSSSRSPAFATIEEPGAGTSSHRSRPGCLSSRGAATCGPLIPCSAVCPLVIASRW